MFNNQYFTPDSVFWRINREAMMVLSGPRALLLELAHPLVAAGVAEHSDFQGHPLRRLFRTVGVMTAINFEPHTRARAARGAHARLPWSSAWHAGARRGALPGRHALSRR